MSSTRLVPEIVPAAVFQPPLLAHPTALDRPPSRAAATASHGASFRPAGEAGAVPRPALRGDYAGAIEQRPAHRTAREPSSAPRADMPAGEGKRRKQSPAREPGKAAGRPKRRPAGRTALRPERQPPKEVRLATRHMRGFLEELSALPAPLRGRVFGDLASRPAGRALRDAVEGEARADILENPELAAGVLARAGETVGDLLALTGRAAAGEDARGQAVGAALGRCRVRSRFAEELTRVLGEHIAADASGRAARFTAGDVDLAVGDALYGDGRLFRRFVRRCDLPRETLCEAVRTTLADSGIVERLGAVERPAAPDRKELAAVPGGCARVAGATLNMARHGLVKSVSTSLAYVVKEAIVVTFIEALGVSGLDFFWRSCMGNIAAMLYYGFGYDELRKLISDNINACFLGLTYSDNRDQDFRWRTWGDFATDRLPSMIFTPAAEGVMGATGVSAKEDLVGYVLSKIFAKSMASFATGFAQAGLRRSMPNTYRQRLRTRRQFNVLQTSREHFRKIDERFSGTRRFRAVPEVYMKLFVYPVSYALTAALFATLYPMEEEAAGYQSDVQKRYLQKLTFYTISTALMMVMLLAGRGLWQRFGPGPEEAADIENQREAAGPADGPGGPWRAGNDAYAEFDSDSETEEPDDLLEMADSLGLASELSSLVSVLLGEPDLARGGPSGERRDDAHIGPLRTLPSDDEDWSSGDDSEGSWLTEDDIDTDSLEPDDVTDDDYDSDDEENGTDAERDERVSDG